MVALATLGTIATIAFAWNISFVVSKIFIGHTAVHEVIDSFAWMIVAAAVKAVVIWLQDFFSAIAAASVKTQLREKLFDAIQRLGSSWLNSQKISDVHILITRGVDSLEPYFAKYLPQLVYTLLVTPVFVFVIWSQDIASGITLVATLPLIPLFMILIGWATNSAQKRQLDALFMLSSYFLETLRGLTTLRVFGRAKNQIKNISDVSEQYRSRTMKVLRISFLSGFALELIGSLSVALIAVSIGLRLVDSQISLLIGLFVLLLAPEAYLPIRQVGAHFHAAAEGLNASQRVLDLIDLAESEESSRPAKITYETGKLTAIVGPSGVGKSTVFRNILNGSSSRTPLEEIAWMPQQANLMTGTVRQNIAGPVERLNTEAFEQAIQMAALDDVSPDSEVGASGAYLSGGQAQRVSLARTFYRALDRKTPLILLDEPTSAIDAQRATRVAKSLVDLAGSGRAVAVITHQPDLIDLADSIIEVSASA